MTGKRLEVEASPFIIDITPSDATIYDPPLLGVRVGVGGDVVVDSGGNVVTLAGATPGEQIPGTITRVMVATTATVTGWIK